jgi:hypothetical protein
MYHNDNGATAKATDQTSKLPHLFHVLECVVVFAAVGGTTRSLPPGAIWHRLPRFGTARAGSLMALRHDRLQVCGERL